VVAATVRLKNSSYRINKVFFQAEERDDKVRNVGNQVKQSCHRLGIVRIMLRSHIRESSTFKHPLEYPWVRENVCRHRSESVDLAHRLSHHILDVSSSSWSYSNNDRRPPGFRVREVPARTASGSVATKFSIV
jgi:hypothetical protein